MNDQLHVGVIGAGSISEIYLQNMITRYDNLQVDCISAAHMESARKRADQFGIRALTTEEMLADPTIDMVVVLTPVQTHYDLIRAALMAGKHVYTEKTMAEFRDQARELLVIARDRQLCLGSAPDTFLGSALQTARRAIDEGILGDIHSFSISATRSNDLLTSLLPFLRMPSAGQVKDYLPYYITALVCLLGPVAEVTAATATPYPTRTNIIPGNPEYGQEIPTPNEAVVTALLKLESGVMGTLHDDAETIASDKAFFAIFGRKGILYLTDPNGFGGQVKFLPSDPSKGWQAPEDMVLDNPWKNCRQGLFPSDQNSRGIGPAEMAEAILSGRGNRASAGLAFHVLDTLEAMLEAARTRAWVSVESTCLRPEPMDLPE